MKINIKYFALLYMLYIAQFASSQTNDKVEIQLSNEFNSSIIDYNATVYNQISDSIFEKKQYYENGKLHSISQLFWRTGIDSSYNEDLDTGELKLVISEDASIEVLHGPFLAYSSEGDNLITRGEYAKGLVVGEWCHYYQGGSACSTFDDFGSIIAFKSYYDRNKLKVSSEGRYCKIKSEQLFYNPESKQYERQKMLLDQRCGVWKYYNIKGDLTQRITYEHVNWK